MNKSEVFKLREQRILSAALYTAQNKGVLDFRMADVARVAACSVGTLYGHFLSKEDMMAALVQINMQQHHEWLAQVELSPLERFLTLLVSEQVRLQRDNTLARIELMIGHTELWFRVADQRQRCLYEHQQEVQRTLEGMLQEACQQQMLELSPEQCKTAIQHCCALLLGFQFKYNSQITHIDHNKSELNILFDAFVSQLQGTTSQPLALPANWRENCHAALQAYPALPDMSLPEPDLTT